MSDGEKLFRHYLNASCGNGGIPTDHAIEVFARMVEHENITIESIERLGGNHVADRVREQLGVRK